MRKFKYPFSNKMSRKLHKKRIELLEKEAKDRYKANRLFVRTFVVLYMIMMVIFLFIMILVEQEIEPIIGRTLFVTLVVFVSIFLPGLILIFPYETLEKKYPPQLLGDIPKDIIAQCNSTLLRFYQMPEDYIITKCYNSSNQLLVDKDLILYFYKDRLRIVNDFTTTIKDFGCYEFKMHEIEIHYEQKDSLMTTVMKSKKLTLSLGKRAKPFIASRGDLNSE